MALARYTQLAYSDPNDMPLVSLPFEALDQVLSGYQQTKDYYDSLEGLSFNYLTESPTDVTLAGQVHQFQRDVSGQIADVAKSGDITKYQSALRSGIRTLGDLRTPGGPVHALENRVSELAGAKKELKDRYDKLTDVNYDYALSQLQPGDIGYNLDTGNYNQITAPTVQDFVDIHKLIRETAKAMVPQEEAYSHVGGDYVWTESGKKYFIGEAIQNVMNSPEIAEQMKINAWYRTNQLSDDQKKAVIDASEDAAIQNVSSLRDASDQLDELSTNRTKSNVTDLQNTLKELGYDPGSVDGVWGPRTEAAYNKAQTDINDKALNTKLTYTEDDLYGIVYDELRNSYLGYGEALRPDSWSRKIQMANWRAKLRAQRAAQQSLLEQFAVATQADLFPVALPASDFDPAKLQIEAQQAVQQSEVMAGQELAKLKSSGVFSDSETLDGVVGKWESLNSLKQSDPEDYKDKFASMYTGGDRSKADAMIATLEYDNVGLIPSLRERARLKQTMSMISSENELSRQTFADRGGEEIIQQAWNYVNQLGSKQGEIKLIGEQTLAGTGEFPVGERPVTKMNVASELAGYNYAKFRDEFIANPDGIPILGSLDQKGSGFRKQFSNSQQKDIEANQDLYRSQINYGIRGDSEIFKKMEDVLLPIEKAAYFSSMNQDPLGTPASYMRDGKEVEVDMEGNADITFSVIGGNPVAVFTRRAKDEKGVARMTVMPSEALGQNEYFQERGLELVAQALNDNNMNDVITMLPFLQTEDPLKTWSHQITSPENEGRIGNIVVRDQTGKIVQPVALGTSYSVLSTDPRTGVSSIVARTPNNNKKYFVGIVDDNGDVNLEPDLGGSVGLPLTFTQAENTVKFHQLLNNPKLMSIQQKFKEKPLSTIPPERRGEIMQFMQTTGGVNMFSDE